MRIDMIVYLDEFRDLAVASWPKVPKTPWSREGGVYVMFTRQGRIMYVGIAHKLGERLCSHLFYKKSDNLRKRVSCRYWWCVVKIVPIRSVQIEVEKALIRRLRPVYNIVHNRDQEPWF